MRYSILTCTTLCALLSGCATTLPRPLAVLDRPMDLSKVVMDIQCEVLLAFDEAQNAPKVFKGQIATVQYTRTGASTLSDSPTMTIATSSVPGSTKFPLGAAASNTNTITDELQFNLDPAKLSADKQLEDDCRTFMQHVRGNGLGIRQYIKDYVAALEQDGLGAIGASAVVATGLIYDVKFTATEGANGGLTFTVGLTTVDFGKPGFSNTDTRELRLTMKAPAKEGGGGAGAAGAKPSDNSMRTLQAPFLLDQDRTIQLAPGQSVTVQ